MFGSSATVTSGPGRPPSAVVVQAPGSNVGLEEMQSRRDVKIMAAQTSKQNLAASLLPVVFVCVCIVFIFVVYVQYHCVPLLSAPHDATASAHDQERRRQGMLHFVLVNLCTILLLVCYCKCIFVHPGTIPESDPTWNYSPSPNAQIAAQVSEQKASGDRRHCKWCTKYKPDRCHHCRACQMCVLRMDHHCPWVYNCIGFGNHKYFVLVLLYAMLDCNFIAFTMLDDCKSAVDWATQATLGCLLLAETLAALLGLMVTVFLSFHIWLMLKGMTTIEFCEKSKTANYNSSVWSRGLYGNVRAVLGDNELLWLLPVSPPKGDGMNFSSSESTALQRDLEVGRRVRTTKPKGPKRRGRAIGDDVILIAGETKAAAEFEVEQQHGLSQLERAQQGQTMWFSNITEDAGGVANGMSAQLEKLDFSKLFDK